MRQLVPVKNWRAVVTGKDGDFFRNGCNTKLTTSTVVTNGMSQRMRQDETRTTGFKNCRDDKGNAETSAMNVL